MVWSMSSESSTRNKLTGLTSLNQLMSTRMAMLIIKNFSQRLWTDRRCLLSLISMLFSTFLTQVAMDISICANWKVCSRENLSVAQKLWIVTAHLLDLHTQVKMKTRFGIWSSNKQIQTTMEESQSLNSELLCKKLLITAVQCLKNERSC